jgi:DNA replication initiation complex subunit (GINS family)
MPPIVANGGMVPAKRCPAVPEETAEAYVMGTLPEADAVFSDSGDATGANKQVFLKRRCARLRATARKPKARAAR